MTTNYNQGWRDQQDERPSGFRRFMKRLGVSIIVALAAIAFCANVAHEAWYRLLDWWDELSQAFKNKVDAWATGVIALAFTAFLLVCVAASGCAGPLAEQGPLTQVGGPVRIVVPIRVQTSEVCMAASTRECVADIVVEVIGVPAPTVESIELRPGSSLTADQGMAESVRMPELGAYRVVEGKVTLSWAYLTSAEERRVRDALALLHPTPKKLANK